MKGKALTLFYDDSEQSRVRVKGLLGILALVAVFVVGIAGGVTYSDGAVNIKINFFYCLSALFSGGTVGYNLFGSIINIAVPAYVSLYVLFLFAAFVAFTALFVAFSVIKKKDAVWLGYAETAAGGVLILFYLLLLTCPFFLTTDYLGNERIFYELYEVSVFVPFAGLLLILAGVVQWKCRADTVRKIKRYFVFYVMLIVPTLLVFVFSVYPIFLQIILSFKDYTLADGIWGSKWNGFDNFVFLFTDKQMLTVIWQTVYLSFLRLLAGVIPSVFFALVFYHIQKRRYRAVVQTIVYIPHFFSWVVIYAIVSAFLTPSGIINGIIVNWFHGEPIDFLSRTDLFYTNMIFTSVWKEVGWGTILYTASLMSIDKSLYDAASIDGAGVWHKLVHITLPEMVPILVFQVIMAVGSILKGAGGEQILLFATSAVKDNKALVIDTWLYWQGLGELKYGLSSAVSFVQSVIGFGLVIGSHQLSRKLVGIGAW